MIKLDRPVIVEGKYDKITLENVIDATIIPTNGFGIFKNPEKRKLIRRLARDRGVIVMTDSDSAGAVIRAYLKKILGETEIINVYVPALRGRERRKSTASREGLLGVEGMTPEIITEALKKSGVFEETRERGRKITKNDMFSAGLCGRPNSTAARRELLKKLGLPEGLSSSAMLDAMNCILSFEEFINLVTITSEEGAI